MLSQVGIGSAFSLLSVLVSWSLTGGQNRCICDCTNNADVAVLSLLQSQLDRCGPEQLTVAAAQAPSVSVVVGGASVLLLVTFAAGVWCGRYSSATPPTESATSCVDRKLHHRAGDNR